MCAVVCDTCRFLTIPHFVAVIHQALARQHALAAPSDDDPTAAAAAAAAATAAGRGGDFRAAAHEAMAEEKQHLAEQYHLGENNEIMTHLIQVRLHCTRILVSLTGCGNTLLSLPYD